MHMADIRYSGEIHPKREDIALSHLQTQTLNNLHLCQEIWRVEKPESKKNLAYIVEILEWIR